MIYDSDKGGNPMPHAVISIRLHHVFGFSLGFDVVLLEF